MSFVMQYTFFSMKHMTVKNVAEYFLHYLENGIVLDCSMMSFIIFIICVDTLCCHMFVCLEFLPYYNAIVLVLLVILVHSLKSCSFS